MWPFKKAVEQKPVDTADAAWIVQVTLPGIVHQLFYADQALASRKHDAVSRAIVAAASFKNDAAEVLEIEDGFGSVTVVVRNVIACRLMHAERLNQIALRQHAEWTAAQNHPLSAQPANWTDGEAAPAPDQPQEQDEAA